MNTTPELPRLPMLGIAFAQGICLYLLYRSFETHVWPYESPLWSFPLWTLAIAVPLLLLLTITRTNYVSAVKHIAGFGALLALVAVYTGWQAEPFDEFPISSMTFAFAVTIGLACFKALMYIQQRADGAQQTYETLFTNSWRNFLVGVLAAIFTLIFWVILMLWAQLFRIIEIDFFYDLFTEEWFIIPTLSVAFGMGVILFRALTRVIDSITKLLHWLTKLLLPLVIAIGVTFLAALPFTGLDPLWKTGSGTALLLWLLALILFFTNAVYQDGREVAPYPQILHRAIYAGVCFTPIVAALAFYGLTLRLNQYGWTVERSWAFVTWLVLSLFAIGYVFGIVRKRDDWTNELARVNTVMGLVVLAIMLLANSPLIDFRKISLASQLERVESGDIELADFDFWYAYRHLTRPGYLAMEEIKADIGDSNPELLDMIENPYRVYGAVPANTNVLWEKMVYRPEPFDVPADLRPLLGQNWALAGNADPVLVRADLDEDGTDEYMLLLVADYGIQMSQFFYLTEEGWQTAFASFSTQQRDDDIRERILNGEITLEAPRYLNLDIGGVNIRPGQID